MTELIKEEIDNRVVLKGKNITLITVLISLLDLTEAETVKSGTSVADNPARMNAITEIVEMAGWIADKEDEALNNKILGKKIESLYEEVNRELEQLGVDIEDVIDMLKELQTAVTLDRMGETVSENAVRLKATKLLTKVGRWKKTKKTVQISMSITQHLMSGESNNLSLN